MAGKNRQYPNILTLRMLYDIIMDAKEEVIEVIEKYKEEQSSKEKQKSEEEPSSEDSGEGSHPSGEENGDAPSNPEHKEDEVGGGEVESGTDTHGSDEGELHGDKEEEHHDDQNLGHEGQDESHNEQEGPHDEQSEHHDEQKEEPHDEGTESHGDESGVHNGEQESHDEEKETHDEGGKGSQGEEEVNHADGDEDSHGSDESHSGEDASVGGDSESEDSHVEDNQHTEDGQGAEEGKQHTDGENEHPQEDGQVEEEKKKEDEEEGAGVHEESPSEEEPPKKNEEHENQDGVGGQTESPAQPPQENEEKEEKKKPVLKFKPQGEYTKLADMPRFSKSEHDGVTTIYVPFPTETIELKDIPYPFNLFGGVFEEIYGEDGDGDEEDPRYKLGEFLDSSYDGYKLDVEVGLEVQTKGDKDFSTLGLKKFIISRNEDNKKLVGYVSYMPNWNHSTETVVNDDVPPPLDFNFNADIGIDGQECKILAGLVDRESISLDEITEDFDGFLEGSAPIHLYLPPRENQRRTYHGEIITSGHRDEVFGIIPTVGDPKTNISRLNFHDLPKLLKGLKDIAFFSHEPLEDHKFVELEQKYGRFYISGELELKEDLVYYKDANYRS